MSLNLKNPRAHDLAQQLATLTGESLTTAVIRALEDRLQKESGKRRGKPKAQRILAFADRFAQGMQPGSKSKDHAQLLYGDDGMPR